VSDDGFDVAKIAAPLHGVKPLSAAIHCPERMEHGICDPPSYMVRLALSVSGFKLFRSGEKVAWSSFLRFETIGFEVRDWKRSTWTIEAASGGPDAREAAERLKMKIRSACEILDAQLSALRRQEVEEGKFFLDNTYLKIRNVYEHFRSKMCERTPMPHEAKDICDALNAGLDDRRNRAVNGCAAVAFYYSAIEVLLDIAYALGNQEITYAVFRGLTWRERMSRVLPVGTDPELGRIHARLLCLKHQVRDRMLHGLGGEEIILLPTPRLGLLPLSYKSVGLMSALSTIPLSEAALEDVPGVFDDFDEWLGAHDPWRDYLLLAESVLPIPLFGDRRQEILEALGEGFEEWICAEQEYESYLLNHWE